MTEKCAIERQEIMKMVVPKLHIWELTNIPKAAAISFLSLKESLPVSQSI